MALAAPRTQIYSIDQEGWHFRVTVTIEATTLEDWIRGVKGEFLDAAEVKCVGLDCEFTYSRGKHCSLAPEKKQRAAVLQLCVAYQCLVFQICHADYVPDLLKEFLADPDIKFCGAAIQNDQNRLKYYGITIPGAIDLQKQFKNPAPIDPPSLIALSNAYLGTNLSKNDPETLQMRRGGWEVTPLSYKRAKYTALDARLGFELARILWL